MSEKTAFRFLLRIKARFEKKGKTGAYIHSILKCLRAWFAFNGVKRAREM